MFSVEYGKNKNENGRLSAIATAAKALGMGCLLLLCFVVTACDEHHVRFYLDEYDFVDKPLKANIEAVVAEQFKEEPEVPLELFFEDPCGLIVTTLDCFEATQRDSVVASYDIEIETMHYEYYGYVLDSLQYRVEGCCMLAGHLCYIIPDGQYFKKTGKTKKISFFTRDEYCPCMEENVYLSVANGSEIQVVPFDEMLDRYGSLGACATGCEDYDSLINVYLSK
jgi:hypothetical protein